MLMTNWQLFLAAGLPTITVLLSIWRADKRADQMEARQDRMEAALGVTNSRIDRIADDMKQFYMILGKHDARLDHLEKK